MFKEALETLKVSPNPKLEHLILHHPKFESLDSIGFFSCHPFLCFGVEKPTVLGLLKGSNENTLQKNPY